jgi:hypothetical protein
MRLLLDAWPSLQQGHSFAAYGMDRMMWYGTM